MCVYIYIDTSPVMVPATCIHPVYTEYTEQLAY